MVKILVVDDSTNDAMRLAHDIEGLGYEVMGSGSGQEALELVASEQPAVVLVDAVMPQMDGVEVCRAIKEDAQLNATGVIIMAAPEEQEHVIRALDAGANDYLTKGCAKEMLAVRVNSLVRAVADHDAVARLNKQLNEQVAAAEESEKNHEERFSNTFSASIQMMVDFLELLQPDCVGLTLRVATVVKDICAEMKMENPWDVDVATMLSHVGCVKVSADILRKVCDGQELSFSEKREYWKHPQIASKILKRIPRMERVARIVEYQERSFNGDGPPFDDRITKDIEIPMGARILRVALAFDSLIMSGSTNHEAIAILRTQEGSFDPEVIEILGQRIIREPEYEVRSLMAAQIRPGMILAEHVVNRDGSVLIANGRTITAAMLRNIHRYRTAGSFDDRIREPIRVRVAVYRETEDPDAPDSPEGEEDREPEQAVNAGGPGS